MANIGPGLPFPHGILESASDVPTGGSEGVVPFPHGFLGASAAAVVANLTFVPDTPVDDWIF